MIRHRYGGIDVSCDWFDVLLEVSGSQQVEARFVQTAEGLHALSAWLREHRVRRGWFCMEHTGGYERALARHLQSEGHRVSLVSGQTILRYRQSLGSLTKTDRIDARLLARYAHERQPTEWAEREEPYRLLQELTRHRHALIADRTAWHNRMVAPLTNGLVRAQCATILAVLGLQVASVEDELDDLVDSEESMRRAVALMTTIKSIKRTTAVGFLAESGPIESYPSARSLALAAGVAPIASDSGKRHGKGKVPYYGNPRLRNVLNMSASNAKRFNPVVRTFVQRLGPKSPKELTAAAKRKLVHIMWGVVVRNEPFDADKAIQHMI